MLVALQSKIVWAIGLVAGLFGLLFGALKIGQRQGRASAEVKSTQASLGAERERIALDDEINSDTDLADRARRSGIVRPPK